MSADELWKKDDRCQHKNTWLEGTVQGTSSVFVHVKWDDGTENLTIYTLLQDPQEKPDTSTWEPAYGFCATDKHTNEELAAALEYVRRRICVYNFTEATDVRCDCKYGAVPGQYGNSEKTGCPELREVIYRLLYKPESFGGNNE